VKTTVEEKTSMEEATPKKDTVVVAVNPPPNKPETPKKTEKISVRIDEIDFNYLKIKSKLHFSNGSTSQSANATFHIKKDSAIWFSVNVLIEAARGVITKDSIHFFALDSKTFKRNYYDLSLDSLSRQFNFKLDFKLLQALFVGNMPIKKRDIDSVSMAGNDFLIRQNEPSISLENLILAENHKLKKLVAKPTAGDGKMTVDYDNFLIINELLFPQNDAIEIISQKDGQISQTNVSLQHSKIEFLNENPGFVFKKK
jgi:Domain of unknown function (DUF4292)